MLILSTRSIKEPLMRVWENDMDKKKLIRIILLTTAIGFIIAGLLDNGFWDVMNKATRICYECIGIG